MNAEQQLQVISDVLHDYLVLKDSMEVDSQLAVNVLIESLYTIATQLRNVMGASACLQLPNKRDKRVRSSEVEVCNTPKRSRGEDGLCQRQRKRQQQYQLAKAEYDLATDKRIYGADPLERRAKIGEKLTTKRNFLDAAFLEARYIHNGSNTCVICLNKLDGVVAKPACCKRGMCVPCVTHLSTVHVSHQRRPVGLMRCMGCETSISIQERTQVQLAAAEEDSACKVYKDIYETIAKKPLRCRAVRRLGPASKPQTGRIVATSPTCSGVDPELQTDPDTLSTGVASPTCSGVAPELQAVPDTLSASVVSATCSGVDPEFQTDPSTFTASVASPTCSGVGPESYILRTDIAPTQCSDIAAESQTNATSPECSGQVVELQADPIRFTASVAPLTCYGVGLESQTNTVPPECSNDAGQLQSGLNMFTTSPVSPAYSDITEVESDDESPTINTKSDVANTLSMPTSEELVTAARTVTSVTEYETPRLDFSHLVHESYNDFELGGDAAWSDVYEAHLALCELEANVASNVKGLLLNTPR